MFSSSFTEVHPFEEGAGAKLAYRVWCGGNIFLLTGSHVADEGVFLGFFAVALRLLKARKRIVR